MFNEDIHRATSTFLKQLKSVYYRFNNVGVDFLAYSFCILQINAFALPLPNIAVAYHKAVV